MRLPEGVMIDGRSGQVTPTTGRYTKRLSELTGIFQDVSALEKLVKEQNDPLVYEVLEYRKEGSDIFFGTTIVEPDKSMESIS
ncbi:hypothetical protein [Rhizobium leguminosarum]|uniref:hypothetical protein n=1 Tax=Rhizobium leguminosarum TaxID=384 RepID=UPI0021BC0D9E|nr:hypothetical protein [Rhizobium leguminosarum]